ncbi:MAG: oligosaccharide flippase family protein [Rhizobiaceae bacterium]|uniref:oligosaccharide flippase family protein n=1 Tax=Parvibaculum sp. TaxID=2024848 RepID=UPI001B1441B8|nr:oligosaccharide flippase family protein [Parvibaculum sp.]MBO6633384.1 oligosaccharide flippase family protein [Parvibaculum sp.]MBO6725853.1 oligosaccharide flippase family protein [Rhizobiaceae bacterium]
MKTEATSYWRAFALVFSGTALAQLIPLLGSLVIARLFVPAEFGTFMAWLGIATLVGVFVTCRFEMALPLENDGEPRSVAAMATVAITLIAITLVVMVGLPIFLLIEEQLPALPPALIALLVPAFISLAASQIWQAWAAAEGLFRALPAMRIVQAASITGLQVSVGLIAPSASGLAASHIAGVVVGVAIMMFWLPPRRLPGGITTLLMFWRRYRKFPYFALPADTINTASVQLPLMIIAGRFGAEAAGYVALAFRTLGAPISLMGTAVLDVFKRRSSTAWRARGECRSEYLQTLGVLAAGSVVATLAFFSVGEELFALAFGERWRKAGQLAIILLPLFALRFVASPLSYLFYLAEKQHIDLMWQVCLLAMTLSTLFLPNEFRDALLSYALGYGLLYVAYLVLSFRFSRGNVK